MFIKHAFKTVFGGFFLTLLLVSAAFAHHGWSWTEDGNFKLTGVIKEARLGNPHGRLIVQAEDEQWLVAIIDLGAVGKDEPAKQPGDLAICPAAGSAN